MRIHKNNLVLLMLSLFTFLAFAGTGAAYAGQCRDPWVTRAIETVTGHVPTGYGNSGDCNIEHYGHGHWSSFGDLVNKVRAAYYPPTAMVVADGNQAYCLIGTSNQFRTTRCSNADNVFTRLYYARRNAFAIRVRGWCLDARNGLHSPVILAACTGSKTQDWWLDSTGQVQNQAHTNGCLDVEGGVGDNRRLMVWDCDYTKPVRNRRANQRFLFGKVRYAPSIRAVPPGNFQSLIDRGELLFRPSVGVITAGGANVITAGGANVISAGGGNVITAGAGN